MLAAEYSSDDTKIPRGLRKVTPDAASGFGMCILVPGVCDIIVCSKYAMKPAGAGLLAVPGGVDGTPGGASRGSVPCGEAIAVSALKSRQGSQGS